MVSKFAIDFTDGPAPRRCIKPWSKTYGSTSHKHKWVNMGELIMVTYQLGCTSTYIKTLIINPYLGCASKEKQLANHGWLKTVQAVRETHPSYMCGLSTYQPGCMST
jgi:hypothetical protein